MTGTREAPEPPFRGHHPGSRHWPRLLGSPCWLMGCGCRVRVAGASCGWARVDHGRGHGVRSDLTPGAHGFSARFCDRCFLTYCPRPARSYCMVASFMQLQRHGWGNHVVRRRYGWYARYRGNWRTVTRYVMSRSRRPAVPAAPPLRANRAGPPNG
jgi:hypothetical protein